MDELIEFDSLAVGKKIKLQGKFTAEKNFLALEASIRISDEDAVVVGIVTDIDPENESITIMDQHFPIRNGTHIENKERQPIDFEDLETGKLITLKGRYTPGEGFAAHQVKVKKTLEFNIDKLKGTIEKVDADKRMLVVNGFTVVVSEKAIILR